MSCVIEGLFILGIFFLAFWIGTKISPNDNVKPKELGKLYVHNCTECGNTFSFNESDGERVKGGYKIQCPHCGKYQNVKK